jgi:hypothetical protein
VTHITTPRGWPDFAQLPDANTHIYMIDEGGIEEGHCIPVPGYASDQHKQEHELHIEIALRWAWDCSRVARYRDWWVAVWSGTSMQEGPWAVAAFQNGENMFGAFLRHTYGGGWTEPEMADMYGKDAREEYHRQCKAAGVPTDNSF